MTDHAKDGLLPCPVCGGEPRRNGRGWVGGVLCTGINAGVGQIHRVQTYGADQAEADAAWNTRATSEASLSVERMRELVDSVERGEFDQLEAAADKWVDAAGVRRMMNAVASVFEKHASQDIMDRFRDKLVALAHLAFVEGAAMGVLQHRAALNATAEGGER